MLLYYFLTSTLKQKPVLFGPVPCVFWFLEIGSVFRTWSWALRRHLIGRAMFWTLSRARCSWLWSWSGLLWSVLVCLICLHIYMSLLMHRAGVIGYVIGYVIWPGIWSGPVLMIPCLWSRATAMIPRWGLCWGLCWGLWSWLTALGSCARLTAACLCLRLTAAIRYDCVAAKRSV